MVRIDVFEGTREGGMGFVDRCGAFREGQEIDFEFP